MQCFDIFPGLLELSLRELEGVLVGLIRSRRNGPRLY